MQPHLLPYNLRIGVTGHRNLPDSDGVREAVENLLENIEHTALQFRGALP